MKKPSTAIPASKPSKDADALEAALTPNTERITDVTFFEPWRTKEGAWKPGKNGVAMPYESFAGFCEDLLEALNKRNVSTEDPAAVAAADRAERTLRTKRPDADPALVRRIALIDAVKGGLLAFAPASFVGNTRSKGTCERVTVYSGDHDHETAESWAAAVALLEALGVAWLAYGSPKDGVPDIRRRMLIALSRDVTPKESARLRAIVPALLGLVPDASTVGDESRLFYIGSVDGAAPYADGSPDGAHAIDVDALLAAHPEGAAHKDAAEKGRYVGVKAPVDRVCPPGVEPLAHAQSLARSAAPAVQGDGGHLTLFNLACDLVRGLALDPDAARALLWETFNPRCVPPWEAKERKDFDRKVSEAQKCERDPGYLLPRAEVAGASVYAPATALDNPIFLCSKDGHVTLMWEGDEYGHRPIAEKRIRTHVRQLGYENSLVPLTGKGNRPIDVKELLEEHGRNYEHTAYAFANTVTHYDPAGGGTVTIGFPRTRLAARYDADADAWLRALAGGHYENLAVWIASCSQGRISKLAACLILIGDADVGKSMFGHAVARMWGQTPPALALVVVQFNADLRRCPILVDEEAQLFGSKHLSTKRFRDIIQEPSRSIELKGKERAQLHGALRAIVSCNGYSDLRFDDMGGPAVVGALRDRMLVIDASDREEQCKGPLARLRLPDDHRVDLERVAGHMAWLCDTVALPVVRFLGAGGDNTEGAILAGHVEETIDLWETFRDWLEDGAESLLWQGHATKGLCADPGALTMFLERAGRGWDQGRVRAALAPFHVGEYHPRGEARLWVLDAVRIAEALRLDPEALTALEAKLDVAEPRQGRLIAGRFGKKLKAG